jgi:hypothetical protein
MCLSELEKLPRGGGGVGGRGGEELPVLIENYREHGSWTVSHAQTEIQRPHIEEIFTKNKNYGQGCTVHKLNDCLHPMECIRETQFIMRSKIHLAVLLHL